VRWSETDAVAPSSTDVEEGLAFESGGKEPHRWMKLARPGIDDKIYS